MFWHCSLGIRNSIQPVKNWVMKCWHSYLSEVRCKWFAHGLANTTATPTSLASQKLKFRLVQPFLCRLTLVVLEKRPLNGCLTVCLLKFCEQSQPNFNQWRYVKASNICISDSAIQTCLHHSAAQDIHLHLHLYTEHQNPSYSTRVADIARTLLVTYTGI